MGDLQQDLLSDVDLRGRKILVADVEPFAGGDLDNILHDEGYVFQEARSGAELLKFYEPFAPDLVLVHLAPGIDGLETCRTLKKTYEEKCAPVIFLVGQDSVVDVVEGLKAGAVDYLARPFVAPEVLARIRLQLESQIMAEQQSSLVERLSEADAEKTKLLKTAANDLRDPLAAIFRLAEFLRKGDVGPLSTDQLDLVDTIRGASETMLTMVNDLLDVAAIESGDMKLQLQKSNLGDLMEKCVYVANMDAVKKKTRVEFQKPTEAIFAQVDAAKIKQVMDNLLSNGVKYSPPGSVITAELQDYAGMGCIFAVRDQGPGIPENERHKLFKDFGRLSVQPTGGEKSTGLGLAICRKIVEAHYGTISAENLPGGGCEFRVILTPPA